MASKKSPRHTSFNKIEINYLYFGCFFALLIFTSASSIFLKENLSGSRMFFFLYAAGQAVIETLGCILLCWLIPRYLGRVASLIFIGITFVLLILHLLDFFMDRILDLSIWETLDFAFDESLENFLYLLEASGIALWAWVLFFCILASLPGIGIFLYRWTQKLTQPRLMKWRGEGILQAIICIPAALLFWEFTAAKVIHPNSYTAFITSLPWKWTFLQPSTIVFPLPNQLAPPPQEERINATLASSPNTLTTKPNIYLFIIESFREDCITQEIAPHLFRFKQDHNHFDLAFSNGNGSHHSWFSIFHSQLAYHWLHVQQQNWKMGSPALQRLKQLGYQIRVYSSAQLNYYGMEKLLFGENRNIVDSFQSFPHNSPISAADADAQTIETFQQDLATHPELKEGQCIIFFWDSTHFDYSWPKEWNPKFTPISPTIAYFHLFQSAKQIEQIKNRYRNAVFYVDSLFGKLEPILSDPESIVIVTGDHAEEFFEHGHLFHNSHLTQEQTHIPLYMKFGSKKVDQPPRIVSQIDIFPSIFDYLGQETLPFFKGESIFIPNRRLYAVSARFNAGRTPYEFCIHNGEHKLIAQFSSKPDILASQTLKIRSICTQNDCPTFECNPCVHAWIQDHFGPAIQYLTE